MLNLTIYLTKARSKKNPLDSYIKPEYLESPNLSVYYVDKEYLVDSQNTRGKIYVFEEDSSDLPWIDTVNRLAKSKESLFKPRAGKTRALILLQVNGRVFALSFDRGTSLIREGYLENDFGIKTNRKLINNKEIKSIKSVSLSDGVISNHRYARKNIPMQYQLDQTPLNVVNDIKGPVQNDIMSEFNMTTSGQNQIQIKVKEENEFLPKVIVALKQILSIYSDEEQYRDNFYWDNEIKKEKNTDLINKLDIQLAVKIKKIVARLNNSRTNEITGNTLTNIQFYPDLPYIEDTSILGFGISGIGYPGKAVLENLDEVQIFTRLAKFLKEKEGDRWSPKDIIDKLKRDNVHYFLEKDKPIYLSKLYSSLYFETKSQGDNNSKHILFQGKWYEVPRDFYTHIEREINAISNDPLGTTYIPFTNDHSAVVKGKTRRSEGSYNEAMQQENDIILFDKKNYIISKDRAVRNDLVAKSAVEPCDLLSYKDNKLQLIHVKIGKSGSGVSHLLNQAYVGSSLYKNDPKLLEHLNKEIESQDKEKIDFSTIDKENLVVVLACIVEPQYINKSNSSTFPLLTAVGIVKTVSDIKKMGFDCRLIKIPDQYKKV